MSKPVKRSKNTSNTQQPTKVEQNLNIHITPHTFDALARLEKTNPELAQKAFDLLKYDLKESHKEKQTILMLEQQEQRMRKEELPHLRRHAKRGQYLAFSISLFALGAAIYFGSQDMEKAAIASIVVPIGTLAVQFIGKVIGKKSS